MLYLVLKVTVAEILNSLSTCFLEESVGFSPLHLADASPLHHGDPQQLVGPSHCGMAVCSGRQSLAALVDERCV